MDHHRHMLYQSSHFLLITYDLTIPNPNITSIILQPLPFPTPIFYQPYPSHMLLPITRQSFIPKTIAISFIQIRNMTQRKAWTEMEDNILKQIYEKRGIKKWSQISRIMELQFLIKGRNGKQCRERYHNHLDDTIKHEKWNEQQQKELIRHHNQIGNKWAQISKFLIGRSENDIKNQFYSILRRGLRQINTAIRKQLKRYKQIQVGILQKIVETCELANRKEIKAKEVADNVELKRTILHYAFHSGDLSQEDLVSVKKFIEKIKNIGKGNKRPKEKLDEVKNEERESDEIESAEYRDDCPIAQIKKQPEQKFRKNSLFNFTLEGPEVEVEIKVQPKCAYKLRKRSSFCSNHSFDLNSPKWNELLDPFKSFQMQETDNFSPKPQFYATSPYFDQSKSSYGNWNQQFYH